MRRIKATPVRRHLLDWLRKPDGDRVFIEEGGTRSGKTKNLCHGWVEYLSQVPGELLSVVRETGPALKATVRRDMIETLREWGVYHDDNHNKTEDLFTFPGHSEPSIEFFATDDKQKVHGRKRHYLWGNEANELDSDTYTQLDVRTVKGICLDYNPSMREDHWIWTRFDDATNVRRFQSTYKDNPFLTASQISAIEALKDQDEWAWQVYGLGLRGVMPESIYRDVGSLAEWPDVEFVYGLDVGYNDPMSLCKIAIVDAEPKARMLVWQLVHESYLRRNALIERMKNELEVDPRTPIYCDHDPELIDELNDAGFNALPARKSKGSVKAGIDYVGRHAIRVGGDDPTVASRARNEWKAYRWKKIRGVIQDEPAHDDSHAPDSGRYPAYTHWTQPVVDYARP